MSNEILTRSELYEVIWSTPVIRLIKKYSISEYGLRKVCKSMNIPLPKPGYWENMKLGKRPPKERLPDDYEGTNEVTISLKDENEVSRTIPVKPTTESDYVTSEFKVPDKLINPDKLIVNTKECIEDARSRRWDQTSKKKYSETLNIKVSKDLFPRALKFMDTFIKIARNRAHKIQVEEGTYIIIGEEKISLYLRDMSKRITIEKTNNWNTTELIPTGKLTFIATFHWLGETTWKDGRLPLEMQMETIFLKLEERRLAEMERRLEIERGWAERREEERIRKELEAKKANELSEFKKLLSMSERWKKAMDLRHYLDAYENNSISAETLTEDKIEWLIWARQKADWYDPEIEQEDALMQGVDRNEVHKPKQTNTYSSIYHY